MCGGGVGIQSHSHGCVTGDGGHWGEEERARPRLHAHSVHTRGHPWPQHTGQQRPDYGDSVERGLGVGLWRGGPCGCTGVRREMEERPRISHGDLLQLQCSMQMPLPPLGCFVWACIQRGKKGSWFPVGVLCVADRGRGRLAWPPSPLLLHVISSWATYVCATAVYAPKKAPGEGMEGPKRMGKWPSSRGQRGLKRKLGKGLPSMASPSPKPTTKKNKSEISTTPSSQSPPSHVHACRGHKVASILSSSLSLSPFPFPLHQVF